jgi:hypothetical protein
MCFDCTNYQSQFPPDEEGMPFERHVFQTIYLNAQHDCVAAKCEITQTGPAFIRQERMATALAKPTLLHSAGGSYIVNMHALHNAHHLRRTLPRNLVEPVPLFPDRDRHRKDAAARLRITGPQKRAEAQRKREETRERNKAAASGTAAATTSTIGNPQPASNQILPVLEEVGDDEFSEDDYSSGEEV